MKMGDDEVGVMDMNIDGQSGEKNPREATDGEQTDESQRVEQRGLINDGSFVERRRPVEYFDCGGNRHQHAEQGKNDAGIYRLAAHEHVMPPNEKTQNGDCNAGERDEAVAENAFARETRDDLAHDSH